MRKKIVYYRSGIMSEAASPTGLSKTSMVVPITNISSLSQAWIDALGLARHQSVPTGPKAPRIAAPEHLSAVAAGPLRRIASQPLEPLRTNMKLRSQPLHHRSVSARPRVARLERLRVAKKIASIHPPQPDVFRRSAGRVTIISSKGIIRLLMQREAGQLRITAVCDPRLVSTITDALYASRVAYAARGVQLLASTHSRIHS